MKRAAPAIELEARGLMAAGRGGPPLDLTVKASETCCLLGPPGRGKEAWLRTLAGVERPAAGQLRLAGRDLAGLGRAEWLALRRSVAYIGVRPALLSVLTAEANLLLGAHYHRVGEPQAVRDEALGTLARLGWRGPLDVLPANLGDWQHLLLALARCLILAPRIVFLHEPFRHVEPGEWWAFGGALEGQIRDGGPALVMVTNNLDFVRRTADQILFAGSTGLSAYPDWETFAATRGEVRDYLAVTMRGAS